MESLTEAYHNFCDLFKQQTDDDDDYQSLNATAHTIVFYTLTLTVLLELYSLKTVQLLWEKQPNGRELYFKAWFWNVFNQYVLACPLYSLVGTLLTRNHDRGWESLAAVSSNVFEVIWLLTIHAIGYYHVHKAFHLSPTWYKYHKFHHRFNNYVPPSAANAVEAVEYVLAYLLPFVVALALWPFSAQIHRDNLSIAASVIGILNLVVHTPKLEGKYMSSISEADNWTRWFVSTEDHLNHHRKLKCHYASPTLNVDNVMDAVSEAFSVKPAM